ncbi:YdcH family protein [Lutibaculum baratangense]|uniref:YdcH family protein n=1 Tax=Lutibaculum baratangense TaxID=1358440 RepID=UPI00058DD73D|nr:DUF465 domain-containing protein [Lutibaculum baratangense]
MSLQSHLHELEQKHRNLDQAILQEMAHPSADDARVRELKKQKLLLKQKIERLRAETVSVH